MMKVLTVVFVSLFVTIPSLIYSVSNWAFTVVLFPLGLIHQLLMGKAGHSRGMAQRIAIGSVFINIVSPLFLILGFPLILYFYVWEPLGWIFFAWMIIYFVSRRFSGVHEWQVRYFKGLKGLDALEQKTKGKKK